MKTKKPKPSLEPAAVKVMPMNLVISSGIRVQTSATVILTPSIASVPIMREGFISRTGILIRPS